MRSTSSAVPSSRVRFAAAAVLLLAIAGGAAAATPPSAAPQASAPSSGAAAGPAAASAGAPSTPAARSSTIPADVRTVTADDLLVRQAKRDPNLVVLDVRTPQEYAEGHVPGAINVPHDQVEQRLGELGGARDKDVVVYCRSGHRAGLALGVLEKAGFKRLAHLDGDMNGWNAAGRPTAR